MHSILKPTGKLFVWYTASRSLRKYLIWRGLRALGFARMYDEVFLCEACSDFATCKDPSEYLAIAHRV